MILVQCLIFLTITFQIWVVIPQGRGSFTDYLSKKDKNGRAFINPEGCTFFLSPTVPGEVSIIIDCLDVKKSTGPNGVPVFILKIFILLFSEWLSNLVNFSFEKGIFPDLLKLAKVLPLHKERKQA